MTGSSPTRRSPAVVLQVVIGIVLGPVIAWVLINALPISSGRASVIAATGIALVVAAVLWTSVRRVRPMTIAFAVAAAATCLLVGLVVAS
ncbi:hypothetical protein [Rhodococcus sp. MEB064]|uniref:hypothetical protein n=1 Tax=Rhodococcus sp. MEB064 TaxID=1587522 RepID=UPI0005AD03AC|nr:hypothetical protein [Rhodococcus sp. MEB064]KIQ17479.1 hypothetical protein RU01_09845 [Rhodococcus sp. MEB064]